MDALQALRDLRLGLLSHLLGLHRLPFEVLLVRLDGEAARLDVLLLVLEVVLDLVVDDQVRHLDRGGLGDLEEGLLLVLGVGAALLAGEQVRLDVLAQGLHRIITVPDTLGELIVEFGELFSLHGVDGRLEPRRLARQVFVLEVLGHLDRERRLLALRQADQRLVEVRHGEAPANVRDVVDGFAADDLLALAAVVDPADDRQAREVVLPQGAVRGLPHRDVAAQLLEHAVDLLLADLDRVLLDAHGPVVAEVDGGRERHGGGEARRIESLDGDLWDAAELQLLVLDGLRRGLVDH